MAEEAAWDVVLARPAEKVFNKTPEDLRQRLEECFCALEGNPLFGRDIRALTGQLRGLYRYRVGDWRVIYRAVREKRTVEVIAILPRGDAY